MPLYWQEYFLVQNFSENLKSNSCFYLFWIGGTCFFSLPRILFCLEIAKFFSSYNSLAFFRFQISLFAKIQEQCFVWQLLFCWFSFAFVLLVVVFVVFCFVFVAGWGIVPLLFSVRPCSLLVVVLPGVSLLFVVLLVAFLCFLVLVWVVLAVLCVGGWCCCRVFSVLFSLFLCSGVCFLWCSFVSCAVWFCVCVLCLLCLVCVFSGGFVFFGSCIFSPRLVVVGWLFFFFLVVGVFWFFFCLWWCFCLTLFFCVSLFVFGDGMTWCFSLVVFLLFWCFFCLCWFMHFCTFFWCWCFFLVVHAFFLYRKNPLFVGDRGFLSVFLVFFVVVCHPICSSGSCLVHGICSC